MTKNEKGMFIAAVIAIIAAIISLIAFTVSAAESHPQYIITNAKLQISPKALHEIEPHPEIGLKGPTGERGPICGEGENCEVRTGPKGITGPTGKEGPKERIERVREFSGPTGPQGPQGFGGYEGKQGPTGPTGPTGIASLKAKFVQYFPIVVTNIEPYKEDKWGKIKINGNQLYPEDKIIEYPQMCAWGNCFPAKKGIEAEWSETICCATKEIIAQLIPTPGTVYVSVVNHEGEQTWPTELDKYTFPKYIEGPEL